MRLSNKSDNNDFNIGTLIRISKNAYFNPRYSISRLNFCMTLASNNICLLLSPDKRLIISYIDLRGFIFTSYIDLRGFSIKYINKTYFQAN